MSRITETVLRLASPVAESLGCEIWDVEYVKEAGQHVLRVYIDKESGVGIDDCERFSRALDPILDQEDPIPDSYVFEVSSAGAERPLRRPSDFARFMGETVELKLYKALDGRKTYLGKLSAYDNGAVELDDNGVIRRFEKEQIAQVRLRVI